MGLLRGYLAGAVIGLAALGFAPSASGAFFHAPVPPELIEVKGQSSASTVFTFEGLQTATCKSGSFNSERIGSGTFSGLTVSPSLSECTAFGLSASVASNGCTWTLGSNGSWGMNCPIGKVMTITAGTCEVQLGSQLSGEMEYTNQSGSPIWTQAKAAVSSVEYKKTKDGFLCPLNGTGEKFDGWIHGGFSLKAYDGAWWIGFWVE